MEDRTIKEILDKVKSPIRCCDSCIEDKNGGYGDDILGCCCQHIDPEDALAAIHARLKEKLPKKKSYVCEFDDRIDIGAENKARIDGANNMIDQVLKVLEGELINGK